ncbi:MAG: serine hydrolase domain-containing protein [Pseudomonadota bacterium]
MNVLKLFGVIVAALIAVAAWSATALYGGLLGWWMDPVVDEGDHQAFAAAAQARIEEESLGNSAFVLLTDGEVTAEHYALASNDVSADTVFPTASFSKWITALGIMTLERDGLIDLDDAVSSHLTRWGLPEGPYNDEVTVRRLLSHMAGLTDGLGFGDYEADEKIPTLVESLNNPRASVGRDSVVAVGTEPGTEFAYSGGSYLILELLIEEVSGQSYRDYITNEVLAPLGMKSSSFDYLGDIPEATASFDAGGSRVEPYKYAAAGATGFVSSAADLTLLVQGILSEDAPLGIDQQAMRAPHASVLGAPIWGLGVMLYAPTRSGTDYVFGHDGGNEPAINASVRINPETRDAFILLANGHATLASDIGADWVLWQTGTPDFLSSDAAIASSIVPIVVGSGVILLITIVAGRRFLRRS